MGGWAGVLWARGAFDIFLSAFPPSPPPSSLPPPPSLPLILPFPWFAGSSRGLEKLDIRGHLSLPRRSSLHATLFENFAEILDFSRRLGYFVGPAHPQFDMDVDMDPVRGMELSLPFF